MLSHTTAHHVCAGHNLSVQHDTTNLAGCVMLSHTTAQHVCAGHDLPVQHGTTNSLRTTPSKEALKLLLSVVQKHYMNLDGSHIIKVKILMCPWVLLIGHKITDNWDHSYKHISESQWGKTEDKFHNFVLLQLVDTISYMRRLFSTRYIYIHIWQKLCLYYTWVKYKHTHSS
jgi:hypothetical protein